MIVKLFKNEWRDLIPLLKENILENYFNILGILSENEVYKDIYVQYSEIKELKSVMFLRKSGTIKFYAREGFFPAEISNILKFIEYNSFIGPRSYCSLIQNEKIFTKSKKLTDLCHLESVISVVSHYDNYITPLSSEHLDKIIEIYKRSFKSFASKEVLKERLETKRGRAFGIFDDKRLVSVAFTDFETEYESLIVGVATIPEYRNRGYGTDLVKFLSNILQIEKKDVFLEYENQIAGNIYKKLGFVIIDSVYKYWD